MSLEKINTLPILDPDNPKPPTLAEFFSVRKRLRRSHSTPTPRQVLWPEIPTSYVPLDASATLWTQVIRKLGVPEEVTKQGLRFEEIYSINDNRRELRQEYENIHALVLALPMKGRKQKSKLDDATDADSTGTAKDQKIAADVSKVHQQRTQIPTGGVGTGHQALRNGSTVGETSDVHSADFIPDICDR
ncbi:uncharacterized protein N0V89_007154 [Didymosphaeria variabile]|uniref:UCH catalytic domain-containing protein n=1 Tax=Didymosphaeria variabile TaxID=1932322 RepID=A0A9W8XIC1_9PLEO|nr:uncharacterized protein N0V89_007154 [Didymosphaeria variabile]KAJ4351810.1 hypothetical protein N0V89_007154 [Didymosphaeria variabile]